MAGMILAQEILSFLCFATALFIPGSQANFPPTGGLKRI
jgi:hypothetical protein